MSNIIYSDTIVSGIICRRCNHELPPMTAQEHLDGKFNKECPHTKEVKFPVKVYTFNPDEKVPNGCDYYEMTESEISNKCCIYSGRLYFRKSIPEYIMDAGWFDHYYAELYDIWNYECTPWWEWPQELKEVMYKKVPRSNPEPQPA